jgi:hypothetical protein
MNKKKLVKYLNERIAEAESEMLVIANRIAFLKAELDRAEVKDEN